MIISKDRVIVIIGASSGIGEEIGKYFLKQDAIVHFVARRSDRLESMHQVATSESRQMSYTVGDARDYTTLRGVADSLTQKYGKIDLWINCAGQNKAIGKLWELNPESVWEEIDVNLQSCVNGTHAALQNMIVKDSGVIINFCGGGASHPHLYAGGYSASKTAIARFTEATMLELEEDTSRVKIFAVNPGLVLNERTEALCKSEEGKRFMPEIEKAFKEGNCQPAMDVIKFIETTLTGELDAYAGRLVTVPGDLHELITNSRQVEGSLKGYLRPVE